MTKNWCVRSAISPGASPSNSNATRHARAAHTALDGLYGLGPGSAPGATRSVIEARSRSRTCCAWPSRVLRLDAYTLAIVGDVDT